MMAQSSDVSNVLGDSALECDNDITHALSVLNRAIGFFEKLKDATQEPISPTEAISPSVCQAPVSA
eukprot:3251979-Pyramimonas_sp.AAC.2